jgi:transcriptional regulator GlxA family with amidase domain
MRSRRGQRRRLSLSLMLAEVTQPGLGSRVMVSRVLDLLFIHALRTWAASCSRPSPGWLTAAMDPVLGPVLTAIHQAPERDWSVDELARLAAFSRAHGDSPRAWRATHAHATNTRAGQATRR